MKKIILFLLIGISVFAQKADPNKIVKELKNKFALVKDYSADVNVKLDIPFFKMPPRNIKVYFKQPDKTHIESKEFSLLPKMGLKLNPVDLLKGDFTAVYLKADLIDNKKVDVINLIPSSDSARVKFVKLWVDQTDRVIRKAEIASDNNSSMKAELEYGNEIRFGLPTKIVFTMDFGASRFPTGNKLSPKKNDAKKEDKEGKDNKGIVTVSYSNFVVNKGIDDKIFTEKKK
jgi:outer membrane lipoprotein-sorting protein